MRLVGWMLTAAVKLDVWLLLRARAVIEFCHEWLSLPQRRLERGLLAVMLPALVCCSWGSWWIYAAPLAAWSAILEHRKPDARRAAEIAHVGSIAARLITMAYAAPWLVLLAFLMVAGFAWWMVPGLAVLVFWPLFVYIAALPASRGPGGRKRKLALAKLKAWFGTAWLPVPQGGPA